MQPILARRENIWLKKWWLKSKGYRGFSIFLKFPLYSVYSFHMRYVPQLGSDDLQMTPNCFWELFITFVHEIKDPYLKLKKSGKVKHPTIQLSISVLFKICPQNFRAQNRASPVRGTNLGIPDKVP